MDIIHMYIYNIISRDQSDLGFSLKLQYISICKYLVALLVRCPATRIKRTKYKYSSSE